MILDTFYLLFKSNSTDLIKGNKEVEKSTKQLGESLKDTGNGAEKLGQQYVKIVESATQALTALISVRAIAGGIFKSANINSELQIQSQLIGQNIIDLKAYGNAVEAFGGTAEGFRSDIQRMFEAASAQGLKITSISDLFDRFRKTLKSFNGDVQQQELFFQKIGISSSGTKEALLSSDEKFKGIIGDQRDINANLKEGGEIAREYAKSLSLVKSSMDALSTTVGNFQLPTITSINHQLKDFIDSSNRFLQKNEELGKFTTDTLVVGGSAFAASRAAAFIPGLSGVSSALGAIASQVLGIGTVVGGLYLVGDSLAKGRGSIVGQSAAGEKIYQFTNWIDGLIHGDDGIRGGSRGDKSKYSEDLKFWMSKGYSREQAAGWVANAIAESGNNPSAVGDGGKAKGLFQWHKDRRDKILTGTGIDVYNATRAQQLEAAAWEAEQRGNAENIKLQKDAQSAAAFITRYYEIPRDIVGESIKRGKLALEIANTTPFGMPASNTSTVEGNKEVNVKIGDVHVNTQATDGHGIANSIGNDLMNHLKNAAANLDDGIAR